MLNIECPIGPKFDYHFFYTMFIQCTIFYTPFFLYNVFIYIYIRVYNMLTTVVRTRKKLTTTNLFNLAINLYQSGFYIDQFIKFIVCVRGVSYILPYVILRSTLELA